jgi:dCTP deaminase
VASLSENGQLTGRGILPSQSIAEFVRLGHIRSIQNDITDSQIQPASIDLRLGKEALRLRASFLPGPMSTVLAKALSSDLLVDRIDLTQSALLEPGIVYIVPLMEVLSLPSDVGGVANPKSTTGRLDIFTRLITETGREFERVPKGYSGALYIEIVSRTFPIRAQTGMKLNQLRFVRGTQAPIGERRLKELGKGAQLIYDEDDASEPPDIRKRGLPITVDLEENGSGVIAYRAKKHTPPIELDKIDYYDVTEFWDSISRPSSGQIVLEPDRFYILASKQKVRVPPELAAEMVPYDPAMGEFRVHYAGFFDPGFGYGMREEILGTKAVLEVRVYEVPFLLEDDRLVGRLNYYWMASLPDRVYGASIGSSYQQQGLALSKQFKRQHGVIESSLSRPEFTLVPRGMRPLL